MGWVRIELDVAPGILRPRSAQRQPVVLTRAEVAAVLGELSGTHRLVTSLLYGSGLRLLEALQLPVKDIELSRREILVREGKGRKDRVVPLPEVLLAPIGKQLRAVRARHEADLARSGGWVTLPNALEAKLPAAGQQLAWQWLFPALRCHTDAASGRLQRHHLHKSAVQRAVTAAVARSGVAKRASCHTFRHSFATHLLEDG